MSVRYLTKGVSSAKKILDKIKPYKKEDMKGSLYEEIYKTKKIKELISPHITPSSQKWKELWGEISRCKNLNEDDLQKICFADSNKNGSTALQHLDWQYIKKNVQLSSRFLSTWGDVIEGAERDKEEEKEAEREVLKDDDVSVQGDAKKLSLADRLKEEKADEDNKSKLNSKPSTDGEDKNVKETSKVETDEDAQSVVEEYGMQQACEEFDMPKTYLLNNKEKIYLSEKVMETIWGGMPQKSFIISTFKIKLHLKDNPRLKNLYEDYCLLNNALKDWGVDENLSFKELDEQSYKAFKIYYKENMQLFTPEYVIKEIISIMEQAYILISNHKLYTQGKKWEKIFLHHFSNELFFDSYLNNYNMNDKGFDELIKTIYNTKAIELATDEFKSKELKFNRINELFNLKGYKIKDPKYKKWFNYEHLNFPLILLSMCIPKDLLKDDELIEILSKSKDKFETIKYTDVKTLHEIISQIPEDNRLDILKGWNDLVGNIENSCQYYRDNKDKEGFSIHKRIDSMSKLVSYLKLFNMKANFKDFEINNDKILWVRKFLRSKKFDGLVAKTPNTAFRLVLWGDMFNHNISSNECQKVARNDIIMIGLFNKKNRLQHLLKLNRRGELLEIVGSVRNDISPDKQFFHDMKQQVLYTMKPNLDSKNMKTYY